MTIPSAIRSSFLGAMIAAILLMFALTAWLFGVPAWSRFQIAQELARAVSEKEGFSSVGVAGKQFVPESRVDSERLAQRVQAVRSMKADSFAVWSLGRLLKDGDDDVRWFAAFTIGKLGTEDDRAVQLLCQAMQDQDRYVRFVAGHALVEIGPRAKAAVPALIEALRNGDAGVQDSAANVLWQIDPEGARKLGIPEQPEPDFLGFQYAI